MVYYHSHRRDNSSSALSFTSSTGSATGASFASADDPSSRSSMLVSLKNILESVYKCDSAAVVDGASRCGSVANQALYQGVEVILNTTRNCSNSYGAKNLTDSFKESVASKPFFEFQCFCDDDDFIVNNDVLPCNTIASANTATNGSTLPKNQHIRVASTGSHTSGESRNENDNSPNPTASLFVATDHDDAIRNSALPEESEEAVTIRQSKWTAHTKSFYSKIGSSTQRSVTKLRDLTPSQRPVTKIRDLATPTISPRKTRLSAELVSSDVSKVEDAMKNQISDNDNIEIVASEVVWVPRNKISQIREQ